MTVPGHAYKVKIMRHLDAIQAAIKPGRLYTLEVRHDPWCPFLTAGTCCCDPDLAMIEYKRPVA